MNADDLLQDLLQRAGVGTGEDQWADDWEEGEDEQPATWEEVVRRIEETVLWFCACLARKELPNLEVATRTAARRGGAAGGEQEGEQQRRLRSLAGRAPESAEQFSRVFVVLQICHDLLLNGQQARQRELWYRLKGRELFSSPRDVAEAVADAASLLAVPRAALGVTCSSKGLVAGALTIHDRGGGPEVNCARAGGGSGHPIPGDTAAIARYEFQTDAAFVLVVEKDTVLQRLAQEGLPAAGPCILVTGRGYPDLATRVFLHALHTACPALPLLGLADWNPSGAAILGLYRWGGRGSEEAAACALPTLRWLGARACMLEEAPPAGFQDLTPRDQAVLGNLRASLANTAPAWAEELGRMGAAGVKAELEAVAENKNKWLLSEVVLAAVEAEDWL